MKRSIVLIIVTVVSFFASAMFFFSSGFFNFEIGQVTPENGNQILLELNSLPLFYFESSTDIREINELRIISLESKDTMDYIMVLDIDSVSTEVVVERIDGKDLIFNLVGRGTSHNLIVEKDRTEVEVSVKYPRSINFIGSNLTLYIKIPEEYRREIEIQTISGDIDVKNIYGQYVTLYSISGNIDMSNVEVGRLEMETTSGKINMVNIESVESDLDTTSGSIQVINSDVNSIETISGEISLEKFTPSQDLTIKTISGKVEIQTTIEDFGLNFKSISGNSNRENSVGSPTINVKTTSGNLVFN